MDLFILILKILGIIFGLFIVLTIYSCCVISGRSNRHDEKLEAQHRNDISSDFTYDKLTEIEKNTVDRLIKELDEVLLINKQEI